MKKYFTPVRVSMVCLYIGTLSIPKPDNIISWQWLISTICFLTVGWNMPVVWRLK
jgi:hypothetical protein